MSKEFWEHPIRKKAFQVFIKEGCENLEQSSNEDVSKVVFYCKAVKKVISAGTCIDCITDRLREQYG